MKNKLRIVKIMNRRKKKKRKIMKSYKLIKKRCFLKNKQLKRKNRLKDIQYRENITNNIPESKSKSQKNKIYLNNSLNWSWKVW